MVSRLESKGAKVCKSCRSRQKLSNEFYFLFFFLLFLFLTSIKLLLTRKNRRRSADNGPFKVCQKSEKSQDKHRGIRMATRAGSSALRSELQAGHRRLLVPNTAACPAAPAKRACSLREASEFWDRTGGGAGSTAITETFPWTTRRTAGCRPGREILYVCNLSQFSIFLWKF